MKQAKIVTRNGDLPNIEDRIQALVKQFENVPSSFFGKGYMLLPMPPKTAQSSPRTNDTQHECARICMADRGYVDGDS